MPYIKQEDRERINPSLRELSKSIKTAGDLNYAISMLAILFEEESPNYAKLNEIMGVLACVKEEYYRKRVVPYEDKKIEENGDLTSFSLITKKAERKLVVGPEHIGLWLNKLWGKPHCNVDEEVFIHKFDMLFDKEDFIALCSLIEWDTGVDLSEWKDEPTFWDSLTAKQFAEIVQKKLESKEKNEKQQREQEQS